MLQHPAGLKFVFLRTWKGWKVIKKNLKTLSFHPQVSVFIWEPSISAVSKLFRSTVSSESWGRSVTNWKVNKCWKYWNKLTLKRNPGHKKSTSHEFTPFLFDVRWSYSLSDSLCVLLSALFTFQLFYLDSYPFKKCKQALTLHPSVPTQHWFIYTRLKHVWINEGKNLVVHNENKNIDRIKKLLMSERGYYITWLIKAWMVLMSLRARGCSCSLWVWTVLKC